MKTKKLKTRIETITKDEIKDFYFSQLRFMRSILSRISQKELIHDIACASADELKSDYNRFDEVVYLTHNQRMKLYERMFYNVDDEYRFRDFKTSILNEFKTDIEYDRLNFYKLYNYFDDYSSACFLMLKTCFNRNNEKFYENYSTTKYKFSTDEMIQYDIKDLYATN